MIIFLPWRAGRGLVVPDNWRRCVRWAVVHLTLAILAAALLANDQDFPLWIVWRIWPPAYDPPHMDMPGHEPAIRMIVWLSHSLLAWTIVVMLPVWLGSLLSIIIPKRHRAAKLGGVKWSLYLSSLYLVMLAAWYGYYGLNPPQPQGFTFALPPPELPATLLPGVYGAWWAAGMAANPYNRVRTLRAFFGFALMYAGSWAIMAWVLFPAGPLDALL